MMLELECPVGKEGSASRNYIKNKKLGSHFVAVICRDDSR